MLNVILILLTLIPLRGGVGEDVTNYRQHQKKD